MIGGTRAISGALAAALLAMAAPAMAETVTAASAAAKAPTPITVDPAKLALAREVIGTMFPAGSRDAMVAGMLNNVLQQFRAGTALPRGFDDPGLRAVMDNAIASVPARLKPILAEHLPRLWEAMARAYTREFSLAELRDIAAFARSPTGRHYLQRSPAVLGDGDVAAANSAYFGKVQDVSRQVRTEVTRDVNAYLASHPDVAARLKESAKAAR